MWDDNLNYMKNVIHVGFDRKKQNVDRNWVWVRLKRMLQPWGAKFKTENNNAYRCRVIKANEIENKNEMAYTVVAALKNVSFHLEITVLGTEMNFSRQHHLYVKLLHRQIVLALCRRHVRLWVLQLGFLGGRVYSIEHDPDGKKAKPMRVT